MMFMLLLALCSLSIAQPTFTTSTATLATPRAQLAATSVNGNVFFGGGLGASGNVVAGIDTFNLTNIINQLLTGLTLNVGRFGLGAASASNLSLFSGGLEADGTYSTACDLYDSTTGTWDSSFNLTTGRAFHASGGLEGKIYVAGGETAPGVYTDTVEIFDTDNRTWVVAGAGLSVARAYFASAVSGQAIYFAGGVENSTISAVVDIYNANTSNWTISSISVARSHLAASSYENFVLFAGGQTVDGNASAVVDIYNTASGLWDKQTLTAPRWGLQGVTVGTYVLFAGGFDGTTVSNVVDVWDSTTGNWSSFNLADARWNFASATNDQVVYFAGGLTTEANSSVTGSIEIFNFGATPTPTVITTPTPVPAVDLLFGLTNTLRLSSGNARSDLAAAFTEDGNAVFAGGRSSISVGFSLFATLDIVSDSATPTLLPFPAVLNVARFALTGTTAGNTTVAAGGLVAGLTPSAAVDIYTAGSLTLASRTLNTARGRHAAASFGAQVFFAGGVTGLASVTSSVEIYETGTQVVSTAGDLSQGRSDLAGASTETHVYFAGGQSPQVLVGVTYSDVVDIWNGTSWTVSNLTVARSNLAGCVLNGSVIFAGGRAADGASAVVDIWDGSAWSTASLSIARWDLQCVVVGGRALFVGGNDDNNVYDRVDIYDGSVWTQARINVARTRFAATASTDRAYFAGGATSVGNVLDSSTDSIEVYDSTTVQPVDTPTPTPTPSPSPSPSPSPVVTCNGCTNTFNQSSTGWIASTTYTVQCSVWDAYFTCLDGCSPSDITIYERQCTDNQVWNAVCNCHRDSLGFDGNFLAGLISLYQDPICARMVASVEGVTSCRVLSVDSNVATVEITWDDQVTQAANGNGVNLDSIITQWRDQLADYFNADGCIFNIDQQNKRTIQTSTLVVTVNQDNCNGQTGGVTQMFIPLVFVLASFLLHVLF